jgi:ubiquinone/menaquinone biosynthesis C-methylase UbiE
MNLVDLGCGKGKVILVWKNFLTKNRLTNNIIGVEYDNSLLSICKNNIKQKKYRAFKY